MLYKIRIDKFNFEEIGDCDTYGIDVFDDNNTLVKSVPDISFNKEEISGLIKDCNDLEVDVCHIDNIIEDFIG